MPSHPVVVHLTADQQHVWDEHNLIKLLPVAFNCIMCLSEKSNMEEMLLYLKATEQVAVCTHGSLILLWMSCQVGFMVSCIT